MAWLHRGQTIKPNFSENVRFEDLEESRASDFKNLEEISGGQIITRADALPGILEEQLDLRWVIVRNKGRETNRASHVGVISHGEHFRFYSL